MTFESARRNPSGVQAVPVIRCAAVSADLALEAHKALIAAEHRDPSLGNNPYWGALRDTAFARFCAAFEVA
jgi:hypothetical protein